MTEPSTSEKRWRFWVDVGGTFTDCLAIAPDGTRQVHKVLSSSHEKGSIDSVASSGFTAKRIFGRNEFWNGYRCEFFDANGKLIHESSVRDFDAAHQSFQFDDFAAKDLSKGIGNARFFSLTANEPAPIFAIRRILGLGLYDPLPELELDLGTTRGTNALLTRTGARTAMVTTLGFRDILEIGDQARPDLFALDIVKAKPLYDQCIEIRERIAVDGKVLTGLDDQAVRCELEKIRDDGIQSLAICLLNSYLHPQHELQVERIAREMGFDEISVSHKVAPAIKIVPRGETTVLDAYLNPVLRDYLKNIHSAFPRNSRLRLMTSTGGLVERAAFSGKDSVLSGPAGGVVGFARTAEQLGFEKIIGFDMGGTSTDVARFDGEFERQFETLKAGIRIVHPMLAIETVAAGGGSICSIDEGRLTVGPASAGAIPGPACYGSGGPLTVTDINLYLGRIDKSLFPFELDEHAVDVRLGELQSELDSTFSTKLSKIRLALGFFEIAVHHMAQAVHNISIARGYDPREYALMGFGGAAPQVACIVAQELGITRILNHPDGPILSAVGNSLADVSNHQTRPLNGLLNADGINRAEEEFSAAVIDARVHLVDQGISPESIELKKSMDLRYSGTDAFLTIPEPPNQDYRTEFENAHRRRFGFVQRRDVEMVAIRVEALSLGNRLPKQAVPKSVYETNSPSHTTAVVDGAHQSIPRFVRDELNPGDTFNGPAIIVDNNTSTFVDKGWAATVCSQRQLILSQNKNLSISPSIETGDKAGNEAAQPDPVLLEVFNNSFSVIAEQMGLTLQQTAISVNVKERLDFSCAIFDARGNLVVNAPHIPVHLGAMSETVKAVIRHFETFDVGDVVVTNDPYQGGSHLPDVTVITPVFIDGKKKCDFFVASRCHHAEIGGITPGSMPPNATCLGEEGVLISNFKVVKSGRDCFDSLEQLLRETTFPSRNPADNIADIRAQIAANQHGVQQIQALSNRYGNRTVVQYMEFCQEAADRKMRSAIRRLRNARLKGGQVRFSDTLDCGATIQVSIEVDREHLLVDFEGTDPVLKNNLNANRGIVTAAVIYCLRLLINESIPINDGILRSVTVQLTNCFLNPEPAENPFDSPPCVGGNVETSQRIVDVLLGALGIAAASQGTMNNLLVGDDSFGYYETTCGGSGATRTANGANAVHTHMTNTRATDPEVMEARFPMRLLRFQIRRGSGGQGRHSGGDGIIREIEFHKSLKVSILSNRRNGNCPYGIEGGQPGMSGRNLHIIDGREIELDNQVELTVNQGDRIQIETPGGGGFGSNQEIDDQTD